VEGDIAHLSDFTAAPRARATGPAVPLPQRAGETAPGDVFITPDGTKLIGDTGKSGCTPPGNWWPGPTRLAAGRSCCIPWMT
jgi:hypothetical protein